MDMHAVQSLAAEVGLAPPYSRNDYGMALHCMAWHTIAMLLALLGSCALLTDAECHEH